MRDAHESPDPPSAGEPPPPPDPASAPDAADFGTAYGLDLSIDAPPKQAPAEEDPNDPLGWIRRWVAHHKRSG